MLDVCTFTVKVYIKYWFQAASAIYSPRIGLQQLKDLTINTRNSIFNSWMQPLDLN